MSRILVTGSTAYDLLLSYNGSFADGIEGQDVQSLSVCYVTQHFARHHGGTGANIAWGLALLQQSPLLVSTVGTDGGPYKALLEERGVRTQHVEQLDTDVTATAIIGTDSGERQITYFHPGADQHGSWPDLADDRDDFSYAIISPRDAGLMQQAAEWCIEYGVQYLFDPGQQTLAFSDDELKRAIDGSAGVIANEYEWGLIQEKLQTSEQDVLGLTGMLIVTQGEEGLTIYAKEGEESIGACKADQVLNPTGAGDSLRAGLLTGLAAGWTITEAGRLGAAMGSLAVEEEGTMMDMLDLDEVWNRVKCTYGEELPSLN